MAIKEKEPPRQLVTADPVEDDETPVAIDDKIPKYKLNEDAYIDDKYLVDGTVIHFTGIPGEHMKPLNAAARAMLKQHPTKSLNPVNDIPVLVGEKKE